MGKVIALSRTGVPNFTWRALCRVDSCVLMCPPRLSTVDRGLLALLTRLHVFVACCASWLCAVLLLALRMPLRTLVGWEVIVRA
jgi:hypothetical protein